MRTWPVERIESEMRRLQLLRYLASTGRYEAAASVLRMHCTRIGLPTTADQLLAALAWLEDAELITQRIYADEPIARLTSAGRDVADGSQLYPGVMRPDP